MEEITCKCCGKSFPLTTEFFYRDSHSKSGFRSECKKCKGSIDKAHRQNNREQFNNIYKEYYEKNKELISTKRKKYKEKNREVIRERRKKEYQKLSEDPVSRLEFQVRSIIYSSFRRKGYRKNTKSSIITGLSSKELTEYLLKTYIDIYGLEWDGNEPVHIDHIIPLASARTEEDVIRLCHYTNLQLLTAKDNLKKGSTYANC